jgi:hypothetical protein
LVSAFNVTKTFEVFACLFVALHIAELKGYVVASVLNASFEEEVLWLGDFALVAALLIQALFATFFAHAFGATFVALFLVAAAATMAYADIVTLVRETTLHFHGHRRIDSDEEIAHLLHALAVLDLAALASWKVLTLLAFNAVFELWALHNFVAVLCKELIASYITAFDLELLLLSILAKVEALWFSTPVDVDHQDVASFLTITALKESVSFGATTGGKAAELKTLLSIFVFFAFFNLEQEHSDIAVVFVGWILYLVLQYRQNKRSILSDLESENSVFLAFVSLVAALFFEMSDVESLEALADIFPLHEVVVVVLVLLPFRTEFGHALSVHVLELIEVAASISAWL